MGKRGGKREGIKRERGGGEKKKRGGVGGKQRWEKEAVRERERGKRESQINEGIKS